MPISYKSCNYFSHDCPNFRKEKFIYEYSLIDWTSLSDPQISVDDHFDYYLKKLLNVSILIYQRQKRKLLKNT